jgi:hypothetical protein
MGIMLSGIVLTGDSSIRIRIGVVNSHTTNWAPALEKETAPVQHAIDLIELELCDVNASFDSSQGCRYMALTQPHAEQANRRMDGTSLRLSVPV